MNQQPSYLFEPRQPPTVPIRGQTTLFPVNRIYCVGRNYAAHAREMGGDPEREPPFFFQKPPDAVVGNGAVVPYPTRTQQLDHEIELVVAMGSGGWDIDRDQAQEHIFGYAVGNDLTRRDLQAAAKKTGRPWSAGKGFDLSAPLTAIHPLEDTGPINAGAIWLKVNDQTRQEADIADLVWSIPEVITELSTLFELRQGDLIFTGTPAGIGSVQPGDRLEGGVEGLENLVTVIGEPLTDREERPHLTTPWT